jgi:serine protease Do
MLASILAAALVAAPASDPEAAFRRFQDSVVTLEVHSGIDEAKSVQGSGYVISERGHIITNYHVVGSYINDPDRFQMRARTRGQGVAVGLVRFDLVNDLALLLAPELKCPPLRLAAVEPAPGSPVVAFGNPHGLGLALIEGIFNGYADKGLVDRMLLSMPLNAGMSGGPILNAEGEVIGTNVSVVWLSNSLSFGVPVDKVRGLLDVEPIPTTREALRQEVHRQLVDLEAATSSELISAWQAAGEAPVVTVGGVQARRPPDRFDCWDSSEEWRPQGLEKASFGCDLEFTPSIEDLGPVTSLGFVIEHFRAEGNGLGFYAYLEEHAGSHREVEAQDPNEGTVTAPLCTADRVVAGALTWKVDTCLSAFVEHPGFFDVDLAATSLDRPREAAYLAVHAQGFRLESALHFLRVLLTSVRLGS